MYLTIIACCTTAIVVALCTRPRRVWRITGISERLDKISTHQPHYATYRAAQEHWRLLCATTAELDAAADWEWRIEEITLQ